MENGCDLYIWFENELELVGNEPAPEPTPEPIQVNVNVTVNISYENSCWYCRKGGLVDRYFAGKPGICPNCGRVCNAIAQSTQSYKPVEPVKEDKKENKPLTTEELKALPNGTRVFVVETNYGNERLKQKFTCWRTVKENKLVRNYGFCWISECNHDDKPTSYHVYLEKPEGAVDSKR